MYGSVTPAPRPSVTWDGRGLPPAAQARMERFAADHVRTSLLSVPAAVALQSVGFDTVGEVMGCMVQQISWSGWGGCGVYTGWGATYSRPVTGGLTGPIMPSTGGITGRGIGMGAGTVTSSRATFAGYAPYVQAVTNGYDTALNRMLLEAKAMGADGVVGIKLTAGHLGNGNREFVALGTAVRARSITRPARLFTTDLPGTDVAKLLQRGWTPVALAIALEVAIRHDDYYTRQQASSWFSGNTEVSGYTELITHTRHFARDTLARKIAAAGGEGAVVSDMHLHVWEHEPGEGHRDHVAEATISGTAIAQFRRPAPRPERTGLTIMPLTAATDRRTQRTF